MDWSEFYDYSTNLLGHFAIEHNYLTPCGEQERKKYFQAYWDFEEAITKRPIFEQDFLFDDRKGIFYLPIQDILNIKIPFNRPPKGDQQTLTAVVDHTPTRSNFWHFSIRWKIGSNFVSRNESRWKEECTATMRALLNACLEIQSPELVLIQDSDFQK